MQIIKFLLIIFIILISCKWVLNNSFRKFSKCNINNVTSYIHIFFFFKTKKISLMSCTCIDPKLFLSSSRSGSQWYTALNSKAYKPIHSWKRWPFMHTQISKLGDVIFFSDSIWIFHNYYSTTSILHLHDITYYSTFLYLFPYIITSLFLFYI